MIQPANRLGEVKEYYFSKKLREIAQMRAQGLDVLNLGIGSPDLPPSAQTIETLTTASDQAGNHAYQSYMGIPELRSAFAGWYDRFFGVSLNPASEILPLIGSKEGVMHIAMAFLDPGDEVLVPNPGYPAYRTVSRLAGAQVVEYALSEEQNWLPDLNALARRDLSKVKLMWVNYPHMPTGTTAPEGFFAQLIDFAQKHKILIVNDNPYSFVLNTQLKSILSVPGAREVALELNSLSKSHNMAGWRIGMLAGKPDYIQTVLRFKSNMDSGMFRPLQLAAVRALDSGPGWYRELNEIYAERREKVFEMLDLLGCTYTRNTAGMFVWAKIPSGFSNGYELSDYLLRRTHVFITPGGIFGSQGDGYIRVSLCNPVSVIEKATERIAAVVATAG
ncbi:MAG: aminotransferase class I/II-fold pyridoxal phosphate-dependent enzyme [Bacteroidetes bacterium]|nr:MAG: aminotransferase class I/II-fold pyridoxal phosphate-dependent enzyme [Bacteroidota bacterium]